MVLEDGVRWAGWSPVDPDDLRVRHGDALFLATLDGRPRGCSTDRRTTLRGLLGEALAGGPLAGLVAGRPVYRPRQVLRRHRCGGQETGELLVPLVSEEGRWIDEPRWWR